MVDIPRSSFIPKETSALPTRVTRRKSFHVFNFFSSALLVVSLLLAGGTFFYKLTLEKERDESIAELATKKSLFSDEKLLEISIFDRKLRAASFLLDNHLAPSRIFSALESGTMERIQFRDFVYEYEYPLGISLELTGETEEFKTVALQADEFFEEPLLREGVFTDLGTEDPTSSEDSGNAGTKDEVHFTVSGIIARELLKYDGTGAASMNTFSIPEMNNSLQGTAQGSNPE
jgi:hypothetical protein